MEQTAVKNILVRFNNSTLQKTLKEALPDALISDYDKNLIRGASVVVTDTGMEDGSDVPGYLPVVIFHDDEDERLTTYFTHELSPYDLPETIQSEFQKYSEIAEVSYSLALDEHPVVSYSTLAELVQIGGYRVVRNGIDQFIRNTTLQLNECGAMLSRKEYDTVGYSLHAIQNNAKNIGAVQLSVFAEAMEDALKSQNYPNFDAMLELAYTLLSSFDYVTRSWTEHTANAHYGN